MRSGVNRFAGMAGGWWQKKDTAQNLVLDSSEREAASKRQRSPRPGRVPAAKVRRSDAGQKEKHGKTLDERKEGGQCSGVIRNRVKSTVPGGDCRDQGAVIGKSLG